jgi:transposase
MERQEATDAASRPQPRVKRPDREQVDPDPLSLDALIPADHPVRMVWELVQELDLASLYERIEAVEGHAGRPAIDPPILVGLWIYATMEGIAKARELQRRCYRDDAFKWLRGGVPVNYHTLADVRVAHGEWLEEQVVAITAALINEGLVTLNQVGQDGMRVRASAGSGSFKSEAKLEECERAAQEQWDRLQQEFADGTSQVTARQRAARERAARERLERVQKAKEECAKIFEAREARTKGDGKNARASTTDPEARKMKMGDNGYRPAYNVQFATTLDTLVIVGADVINAGNDAGQMQPMVERIEQQQQATPEEYYTDGGFSSVQDIENVSQHGTTVYTPVKEAERKQREGKDPYAARQRDTEAVGQWRERMGTEEAKAKYQQRSKCEWSNAMARNRGLQQFVVRGLAKVKAVIMWYALVHNLLRAVALRARAAAA